MKCPKFENLMVIFIGFRTFLQHFGFMICLSNGGWDSHMKERRYSYEYLKDNRFEKILWH